VSTRRIAARTFAADPSCVAQARDWVYGQCLDGGVDLAVSESARLLTSEIVTNAIVHTASRRLVIRIMVGPAVLEVAVDDADPYPPQPRCAGPADTGGRGLALVGALADEWGTRRNHSGKTVWFRVLHD
jgi:anti-sigma regulatory factor (Ser/Thr protein kinase)